MLPFSAGAAARRTKSACYESVAGWSRDWLAKRACPIFVTWRGRTLLHRRWDRHASRASPQKNPPPRSARQGAQHQHRLRNQNAAVRLVVTTCDSRVFETRVRQSSRCARV